MRWSSRRLLVALSLLVSALSGCQSCDGEDEDVKMALIDGVDDALTKGGPGDLAALMLGPEHLTAPGCEGDRAEPLREIAADRAERARQIEAHCRPFFAGDPVRRLVLNYGSELQPIAGETCPWRAWEKSELFYAVGDDVIKVTLGSVLVDGHARLTGLRCTKKAQPASEPKMTPNCEGRWPIVTQAGGRCP